MGDQVEIEDVLGFHEANQDVLAYLTQPVDHEVVCVDHQSQEVSQGLLDLAELISVQVLDDCDEVLPWNTTYFDLANTCLLVNSLASLVRILLVLNDV